MGEEEKESEKKRPKLRGWLGKKGGSEEVSGSVDSKIKKATEKEEE